MANLLTVETRASVELSLPVAFETDIGCLSRYTLRIDVHGVRIVVLRGQSILIGAGAILGQV